jgi:endonuclease/exonuclease/phosphatase family metal-dependent hydrolase
LKPAAGSDIRVVTWNLEKGNLLKQREAVIRVLAAMEPDIVLIQEIEDGQTEQDLAEVLQAAMPGAQWTTALSPRSGTIKSGIATRLPAQPVPSFKKLKRRGESHGHVRAAALDITIPNLGNVLAVSAHLKCCGIAGGPEDLKRIGEVMAIRRAVVAAETEVNYRGLVIGGDLNLVGGLLPLQLLVAQGEGLIERRDTLGDLLIVEAMQPDGSGVQTWQEDGQSYTPGQLDFIVVTGSSLQPTNALVLDTQDIPERALRQMNLERDDTALASDHLPVFVDLKPAR